jgi:hypothetical protein
MAPVRLIRAFQGAVVPALFTATSLLMLGAPAAFADSSSGGKPLILDTQSGISDGHSGTVLQTAPLSHERIVQAKPIATPTELNSNSSTPIIVACRGKHVIVSFEIAGEAGAVISVDAGTAFGSPPIRMCAAG